MASKKPKPVEPKDCEIILDWGYGWCAKGPYNYRCNKAGRVEWDRYHGGCSSDARCRCDE